MSDVQLDFVQPDWVTISGAAVQITAADVVLDHGDRRGGQPGPRRALVHDEGDALTVNFDRDYTGGLRLNDAVVRLRVEHQEGDQPQLPRSGRVGELRVISLRRGGELKHLQDRQVQLWLCVGRTLAVAPVSWVPIGTGDAVKGSLP